MNDLDREKDQLIQNINVSAENENTVTKITLWRAVAKWIAALIGLKLLLDFWAA